MEMTVRSGLVMAWRLATWPTIRSPSLEKATIEGVVRLPSALGMTTASPPSITDTQELVVPKSIPMILDIMGFLLIAEQIGCWVWDQIYENVFGQVHDWLGLY